MNSQKTQSTQIGQYIREVVMKEQPETVERLIMLVQQKYSLPAQEIMGIGCHAGLRFKEHQARSLDLKHYVASTKARWYWFTIALCMLNATVILILPQIDALVYIRYLLGSVLVFWIPGYCVVKSLFPGKELEKLELVALSLGTSSVLVPLMTLILQYTPWGIKTAPVTIVLLIQALAFSTLALFREHQELSKR